MNDRTTNQQQSLAPEVSLSGNSSASVELGMAPGQDGRAPGVKQDADEGLSTEVGFEGDGRQQTSGDGDGNNSKTEGDDLTDEERRALGEDGEDGEEGEQQDGEALPEFDPDKPEVLQAYDKEFLAKDGGLNLPNLSKNWFKNVKRDGKGNIVDGSLDEGVYKYLEGQGIDRATVKRHEAGEMALRRLDAMEVFEAAGGQDKYMGAIEWAKGGGYDDAARKEFNAALDAGGAKRKDAIDLLMQRHAKANPPARRRRPVVSSSNAGNPGGGQSQQSGAQPYESYSAYQADLRKARESGDNALLREARARFKASTKQPWRQ